MKLRTIAVTLLAFALTLSSLASAQTPAAPPATAPVKIKLLVVTGGHGFQPDAFFKLFDNNPNVAYTSAVEGDFKTGSATAYDRPDLLSYDVVLLYDFQLNATPEERKNFLALFDKGTGLIVLHHALLSFQDWPDYERIAGGLYLLDKQKVGDKTLPESTYQGNTEMNVTVVDKNSPVTAGLSDFHMKDELYRNVPTTADIHPILMCEDKPLAWTRTEKNSRIVTILIGHGPGSFNNPNFLKLLNNALEWTAKRDADK